MPRGIKDIPEYNRPREKLAEKGAQALSNPELIAVIIGSGIKGKNVLKIAEDINKILLKNYSNTTFEELKRVEGIGHARASQIAGAIELAKRFILKDEIKIKSPIDIVKLVSGLKSKKQEYFLTLTLNGASNLIQKRTVFIGTLDRSIVHPREVFADAISDHAAAIIFIHNHPSGNTEPSKDDISITDRLVEVGKIIGIEVLEHIIIAKDSYFSFKEHRLI